MKHDGNPKYSCDVNYFDVINTMGKAYVLGLFYTDGNVSSKSNRICLGMNDEDVVKFVKEEFHAT